MIDYDNSASRRLIAVLSGAKQAARGINGSLHDLADAAEKMGNDRLAGELRLIGEAVYDLAEASWQAHGDMLAEQGQQTHASIGRTLKAILRAPTT